MKRFVKKINRQCANSDGFTLVEAMIGMLVFTVGILGVLALQTTSVNNNTLAEDVQTSTVTAMDLIEELMATDFDDMRIANNGQDCDWWSAAQKYWVCSEVLDDQGMPGAKKVNVTSRFTAADGSQQTIDLTIFKPDIDGVSP